VSARFSDPTSAAFFDEKYAGDADPWAFATSPYEQGRYADLCRALGAARYERAFEPGCSVGALTTMLAPRCGSLLAMDISPHAVAQARRRCAGRRNVELVVGRLPEDLPDGPFDLIVFSEIGYYFAEDALRTLLARLVRELDTGGTLAATHWTGTSVDHVQSGPRVHAQIDGTDGLTAVERSVRAGYELGVWTRR